MMFIACFVKTIFFQQFTGMKSVKEPLTTAEPEATSSFRTVTLRITLLWMFIVFAYWMFTSHLPSQLSFSNEAKAKLPSYLSALSAEHFQSYRMLFEVVFSVSLLILLFLPKKRVWFIIHFISAVLFAVLQYVLTNAVPIPVTAYVIFLCSFFFHPELKFIEAWDFMLNLVIVLIVLYASNYFVRWYNYFHGSFYHYVVQPQADTYDTRSQLRARVMPWFYCLFLLFLIRIFTPRFNKFLLIFCILLLAFEFYINNFFDPGLTFMLFPFITWSWMYKRFTRAG